MSSEENKGRARVLLADDHADVLKDLRVLVESEFDVVGAVANGDALLGAVEALAPDVVVTDIAMPGRDGMAAAGEILRRHFSTRIVFVTVHQESEMVQKGLSIGALGYVVKVRAGDELVDAIHAVLRGNTYVSPSLSRQPN